MKIISILLLIYLVNISYAQESIKKPLRLVSHANTTLIRQPDQKVIQVDNTLEGMNEKYKNNFKFYEFDFSWSTDKHLLSIHDIGVWEKGFDTSDKKRPDHKTFMETQMCSGFTQLDIRRINKWLIKHPDTYIITDIKDKNAQGLEYIHKINPKLAQERYIPQLMKFSDYKLAKKLGYKKTILTLYQLNKLERKDEEIIKFVSKNDIYALAMPYKRALESDLALTLKQKFNTFVYVHTISYPDPKYVENLENKGAQGFYVSHALPHKDRKITETKGFCKALENN